MTLTMDLARYRRMMASTEDGLTAWWYLGGSICDVAGLPRLPLIHAETVMIYKTETIDAETCAITWWEIGYFRDPVTGEIAESWRNPVTGATTELPKRFEEGPAVYTVRQTDRGVQVALEQPQAHVHGVELAWSETHGQAGLIQTERKARGYPRADGTLPLPGEPGSAEARTVLAVYSPLADDAPSAPCSGFYEFELALIPPWTGLGDRAGSITTYGRMHKAAVNAPLNPIAWDRLQAMFPDRFRNGKIAPHWG